MKLDTLCTIRDTGLMPNVYLDDYGAMKEIAAATLRAGCQVLEFVNRGPGATAVFAALAAHQREALPSLVLGAGTVTEEASAAQFINAGAAFIVGPNFNSRVARLCARRGIPYAAGVATATEMSHALEAGADLLKVFPARELGGPDFIRAVRAPLPHAPLMPSGGVSTDPGEIRDYIAAGAVCLSIGSALFPPAAIKTSRWDTIESGIRSAVEVIAAARIPNPES